jgi:hypothetical protein
MLLWFVNNSIMVDKVVSMFGARHRDRVLEPYTVAM